MSELLTQLLPVRKSFVKMPESYLNLRPQGVLVKKNDEEKRLAKLEEYAILDTEDEQVFDDITHLASYICKTPIALITFVARDKQWFKSKVSL